MVNILPYQYNVFILSKHLKQNTMKHNYKNYVISTNQDGDYLAHLNGLLMFGPVCNLDTLCHIIDSFIIYGKK